VSVRCSRPAASSSLRSRSPPRWPPPPPPRQARSPRWWRSIVRSHLKVPPHIRTGAAALVGRRAVVLERIVNDEGVGCVKIDGDVWTARSLYDDHVIEPGTIVDVVQIKGATALVSE
jgi:membrane protein implicated in regulation of membrane protease activity